VLNTHVAEFYLHKIQVDVLPVSNPRVHRKGCGKALTVKGSPMRLGMEPLEPCCLISTCFLARHKRYIEHTFACWNMSKYVYIDTLELNDVKFTFFFLRF
jgi:hypothetical protein